MRIGWDMVIATPARKCVTGISDKGTNIPGLIAYRVIEKYGFNVCWGPNVLEET